MKKSSFGTTADGKAVDQYTLTNSTGASVDLITYGATITRVLVPDKTGKLVDVALGFDNLLGYEKDSPYFGCTVGRVANRIANGEYSVEGKQYSSAKNNGPNSLHGGLKGYDKQIWDARDISTHEAQAVRFTLIDPDGSEGFPGTVKVQVDFTFTSSSILRIDYTATTDKTTPINLTNHSYWNLKDGGASSIANHILKMEADAFTPVDDTLIPTGEIKSVKGTPIDFTSPKPIGQEIDAMGGDPAGYDHNLVLNSSNGKLAKAVQVYEPTTGRWMEVWTTEPGMQFYSGNFLNAGFAGKAGVRYARHSGFAFEAQKFPDSINQTHFPSPLVKPGEVYHQTTEYRFGAAETQPF